MTLTFRKFLNKTASFFEKEPFFVITLVITIILAFFSRPHLSAVNWNVISTMFCLMIICAAFEKCSLLTSLAKTALTAFRTPRRLGFVMIAATGLLSMFVTNDVALLTVVPLTLTMARVSKKNPCILIILETVSANMFSAMTPFGNPQNLYLYNYYKIEPSEFFSFMVPLCLFGGVLLCLANVFLNKGEELCVTKEKFEIEDKKLCCFAGLTFIVNILSVIIF